MTVMHGLGLAESTQRLGVNFMGCFGTLSGLKTAKALAAENINNRVLMVCCELCSLHMQLSDVPDSLVASAVSSYIYIYIQLITSQRKYAC